MNTATNANGEPVSPPQPPPKKCEIEAVLGKTVNGLLQNQPANPQVRAQALNKLGQAIPPELVEYDAIKDWIEANIEPPKRAVSTAGAGNRNTAISIETKYTYTEVGRCDYSADYAGTGDVDIREHDLREYIQEALDGGHTAEWVADKVRVYIYENAGDFINGDIQYDSYNNLAPDETRDQQVNIRQDVEEVVRDWMAENMPDELETLDNN